MTCCSSKGCSNRPRRNGLCNTCSQRARRRGDVDASTTCTVPRCNLPSYANAMCNAHYLRSRKGVSLDLPVKVRADTAAERVWLILSRTSSELTIESCWNWPGWKNSKGYGKTKHRGKTRYAHRVAYADVICTIPTDLEIDHLCRNPSCCNPWHMDVVTKAENIRRRHAAGAAA